MYYEIEIAGLKRKLPLCPITDSLYIGAFIMFGDVEITRAAATELLKIAPEHDIMITAESKGIPLVYEMARQSNAENYLLARKTPKLYMRNIFSVEVKSITHATVQTLYLDGDDAEAMRGKRVLIVDDVVSTGESLRALETLVTKAGGIIAGKMCVLAEGDAANRDDIKYLSVLPVFNADGTVSLRIFVDRSSVEVFESAGRFALTNTVFPISPYTSLTISAAGGKATVTNLSVNAIKL